jgi:AcrR family transcriptional regulator
MVRRGPRGGGLAKRERILRAAIKIFSQKGFFSSKVSDIATQAGVADGTIYLYFKNKDDLLISLFEEKMAEVVADVRERVDAGDGALSRLKIFIENHMNLLVREAGLIEVLQVELRQRAVFGALDEMALAYVLSRKRKYDPADAAAEIYRIFAEGLCRTAKNKGGRT